MRAWILLDVEPFTMTSTTSVVRMNWGCGPKPAPDWLNCDRVAVNGVDIVRDIRDGLPLDGESVDYIVGIHALQDLPYLDVMPSLVELRRVLRPGGALRLGLPDLERAIAAWARGDRGYFYIPDDDVRSLGGKLVVQIIWYGSVRTPFTYDLIEELLARAGFRNVARCGFGQTSSGVPDIVELDNRERESLFVEATK